MHRLFLVFFIFFSSVSLSQNVERIEVEITTDEINRRLIERKALNDVSRSFVKNFLGEDKFNSEKLKIEKNIIKNKNRYILFTKTDASVEQENGTYLTKVHVGLSKDNLQSLLVEHDLFYTSQGASCVLPIVAFETKMKNKDTYRLVETVFCKEKKSLSKISKSFLFFFKPRTY